MIYSPSEPLLKGVKLLLKTPGAYDILVLKDTYDEFHIYFGICKEVVYNE